MTLDRRTKLLAGLVVAATILIVKLFSIQILSDRYKKASESNAMVYDVIYPTRGIIYDRNGRIVVGNSVAYDILVSPKEISEPFDTMTLAAALDVTPEFISEKFAEYHRNWGRLGNQPVVMLKKVAPQTYIKFAELQYRYPAFKGQMRSIREYPINAGGNLLGYVSEVDANFVKDHPGEYRSGDYAGKTGIEAAREEDLKGEKGYHVYLRDAHNQIKNAFRDGEMDKEAIPGKDIVTTIDAELQEYGQRLMQNKVGSVVAIEPSTGEILAMVSSPGIDVSQLEDIGQYYSEIVSNPYRPMFNRAVQASYPPGSVFKLVNGLIGLQEGVLKPSDSYPCYAGFPYGNGKKLGCHHHSSPLALMDAIATSCNGYFCYVFRNILDNRKYDNIQESFDTWREYVSSFGFGHSLGSDFPAELGGNIPTSAFYNKVYGKKGWKFTTIVSLSIGQGEIGVTPLQIANMCATVANRGFYYIPHIIKDSEGVKIDEKYHEKIYTKVDSKYFDYAVRGMYMAVNGGGSAGGTAFAAAIPGIDVCGKTGTAQNPRGADNSVFICFAPKDNPKIAIAAYVENAGFGATWACPIASLMVEKYLTGDIRPERKDTENRILQTDLMWRVKKD